MEESPQITYQNFLKVLPKTFSFSIIVGWLIYYYFLDFGGHLRVALIINQDLIFKFIKIHLVNQIPMQENLQDPLNHKQNFHLFINNHHNPTKNKMSLLLFHLIINKYFLLIKIFNLMIQDFILSSHTPKVKNQNIQLRRSYLFLNFANKCLKEIINFVIINLIKAKISNKPFYSPHF